jgi:ferrous iron transport protein A
VVEKISPAVWQYLGFVPGSVVTVIQNYGHGPVLVTVKDVRIALGRGEALKVLVEVLPEE